MIIILDRGFILAEITREVKNVFVTIICASWKCPSSELIEKLFGLDVKIVTF